MSIFIKALRQYFRLNEIGIRDIAASTGISQATVSRFLNGKPLEKENYSKMMDYVMKDYL